MKISKIIVIQILILITIKSNAAINNFRIFVTDNSEIGINQIITQKYKRLFCYSSHSKFEATDLKSTYWVYLEINNEKKEALILESSMFFYDIKFYFFTEEMKFLESSSSGYQLNINKKQYKTSSNAIEIPIKPRLKCFIRFKTYLPMGISITILKNNDFVNQKLEEHNYNNIINGIFFLAILYSAFFTIILRSKIYFYYMCYVVSFWVFMQSINMVTPMYFSWLDLPFTMGYYIIPHYLMSIFLILYSNELLQLQTKIPWIAKVNKIILLLLCIFLISYLIIDFEWQNSVLNIIAVIPSFFGAIILIFRKYYAAWFVFTGIALIFIAFVCLKLDLDRYIPLFFVFSFYGILEMVIFGISITYWLKSLFVESEKAMSMALNTANELTIIKENQNSILEKEVALKTIELKIANEQLEKYVQKVEGINVNLEKDNNSLKVEVIDQITARSEDKIMNFNEFKVSFPDEQSCYNRLELLKWNKAYKCPKCNNIKFLEYREDNKNTKRRCTSCGFIETTTSSTLFHNIKFPIQKAFYLTYVICSKKNKTLEEFSLEISLRTATIHAFSKKIKEAMAVTKPTKKHKDGWTHIMLYNTKINDKINISDDSLSDD